MFPSVLPKAVLVSAPLGVAAWWISRTVAPSGRIATLALLVAITAVGGAAYIGIMRVMGGVPERPPHAPGAPDEPDVVDLDPADVGIEE